MRLRMFLAVVAAMVLGWPGVAHAKGPTEATIEGDSLDAPILISGAEGGSSDYWKLVEQSGFFETTFGQTPDRTLKAAPTDELGPAFVVTWRVPYDTAAVEIREMLYPYAEGGPLAYTAPGQTFVGGQETHGGWFRAPVAMTATLERLGVPLPATASAPAQPATPSPAPPQSTSGQTAWWPETGIVVLVAVALIGGGFATRRRMRVSPA